MRTYHDMSKKVRVSCTKRNKDTITKMNYIDLLDLARQKKAAPYGKTKVISEAERPTKGPDVVTEMGT